VTIIADVASIFPAMFAILVIKQIQDRQQERYRRILDEGAGTLPRVRADRRER
jgi:hypothetical protein